MNTLIEQIKALGIPDRTAGKLDRIIQQHALQLAEATSAEIEANQAALLPRCNGRPYWQDGHAWRGNRPDPLTGTTPPAPEGAGKLYANHSAGCECPLHGLHQNPTKPLRLYIGTKAHKIAETLTAMENEDAYQQRLQHAKQCHRAAARTRRDIFGIPA